MKNSEDYKWILNFHRLFGLSYGGVNFSFEKQRSKLRKYLLITLNIVAFLLIDFAFGTFGFVGYALIVTKQMAKNLYAMIFIAYGLIRCSDMYLTRFTFLFRGKQLRDAIENIHSKSTLKIGKGLTIKFFLIVSCSRTLFFIFESIFGASEEIYEEESALSICMTTILAVICMIISRIAEFSVPFIIYYISKVVSAELQFIKNDLIKRPESIRENCTKLHQLSKYVSDLNQTFKHLITTKLFSISCALISNLPMVIEFSSEKSQLESILLCTSAFIELLVFSIICQIIPSEFEKVVEVLEKLNCAHELTNSDISRIHLIEDASHNTGFTSSDFFVFRKTTLLPILAFIVQYVVIFIQTNNFN